MTLETIKMIEEMAGIDEPWELFEPYIWKDKIGDSLWHCEIRSVDATLAQGMGVDLDQAIERCYREFKK